MVDLSDQISKNSLMHDNPTILTNLIKNLPIIRLIAIDCANKIKGGRR